MKLNQKTLDRFEKEFSIILPESFKDFVLNNDLYNVENITVNIDGKEIYSLEFIKFGLNEKDSIGYLVRSLDILMPKYLPIAIDMIGNIVVLDLNDNNYGAVLYYDHEQNKYDQIFKSFNEMYMKIKNN